MTRTAHATALALSLVMTLAIFSSVSHLSSPSHAGAALAQVQAETPALRS
jgi:DMSO reductase anchor subunit